MPSPNFETIVSLVYTVILWQILKLLLSQDQPQKKTKVKVKLKANRKRKTEKTLPRLNYKILEAEKTTETKNHLKSNHPANKLKESKKKTTKEQRKRKSN